ncbi:MAG TPA: hypothetical protein VJ725_23880 [Thermoanaerobaculia bacterium]|nr:hypothetical protein [Thermoanaerobaculia bacterium]
MGRHHHELADPDRMLPLGSPKDTKGNVIEPLARGEQVPALDGPASDVNKADTFWHVSKWSHAPLKTEIRAPIAHIFFLNGLSEPNAETSMIEAGYEIEPLHSAVDYEGG